MTRQPILARLTALSLLAVLLAPPASASGATVRDGAERESLQQLLTRLRTQRDQHVIELRGRVDSLIRVMETEAATQRTAGLNDARARLVALGAECAPLLVTRIDPGENPSPLKRSLAIALTDALVEIPSPAIVDKLLEMAQKGSTEGRVNALKVLAVASDPERVNPTLETIFKSNQGEVKAAALTALARIGGPENEKRITDALADRNPDVVRLTLESLANAKVATFSNQVLGLLEVTHHALPYSEQFLRYYRACPEVLDKRHVAALVHLAQDFAATNESRVRVIEFIGAHADKLDNELKKEVRKIADSPAREVRESALVLLCTLGDKTARKDLLDDYDAQVERGKNWANSYEARGNILYRIGDYREATNDYKKALELASSDFRARQEDSYVGLARCYMQTGKLKEAHGVLEKAPLPAARMAELAKEPVFAKLVEHSKYGAIFRGQ